MLFFIAALANALVSPAVQAQVKAAVTFDVASVRPAGMQRPLNSPDIGLMNAIAKRSTHGRFELESVPVSVLIELAYDVKDFQVIGLPEWAKADEFDINARTDGNESFEQMRPMLQALLGDRFGIKFHTDIKDLPVYEMEVLKAGLKIHPEESGGCVARDSSETPAPPDAGITTPLHVCGGFRMKLSTEGEEIDAVALTMPKLAEMLSKEVGRPVIDKTGFTQPFDFDLRFAPESGSSRLPPGMTPDSGVAGNTTTQVSIFTALQEQLGLRLRTARGPVHVLAIEQVERPRPN